jgi:hypothetical protein
MSPISLAEPTARYLSMAEREEIACGLAAGRSPAVIARELGPQLGDPVARLVSGLTGPGGR